MNQRLSLALALACLAAAPAGAESFKSWAARGARQEREKDASGALASYSSALSEWKEADGASPKAKVLCARAGLREKNGDESGAAEDFTGCLALDKKNARAYHRRGSLRLKAGKTREALGDFYRATALDLGFGAAYADRARAYEILGEKEFAREDYRRACELGVKSACPGKPAAAPSAAAPRFEECVASLEACVDGGGAFGACVSVAADCGGTPSPGCCPTACLKAFAKSADSEAAAFRLHFSADAACAILDKR